MDLNKFDEPFSPEDIEWRIQQSGKTRDGKVWAMVLAYVTNRAIMKRLDDVCGKAGWRNEYRDIPNNGGVECGISIRIDSEWVTMPLLDSFTVDHTRMEVPAVRVAKTMNTPHGDAITVFDLRFCVPNKEVMPEKGIHTLEHLFAGFMHIATLVVAEQIGAQFVWSRSTLVREQI